MLTGEPNSQQIQSPSSPFFVSPNYWTTDPTISQAFAEYSEAGHPSHGIDDTCLTLRAILPFSDASARQSVQQFQGIAPVFDTRVVCTRPQVKNLKVDRPLYIYLRGRISTKASLPRLAGTEPTIPFNIPLLDNFLMRMAV